MCHPKAYNGKIEQTNKQTHRPSKGLNFRLWGSKHNSYHDKKMSITKGQHVIKKRTWDKYIQVLGVWIRGQRLLVHNSLYHVRHAQKSQDHWHGQWTSRAAEKCVNIQDIVVYIQVAGCWRESFELPVASDIFKDRLQTSQAAYSLHTPSS